MYKKLKIAVVTGGYNEGGKISKMLAKIPLYVDHIVFTDDASSDDTVKEVRSMKKNLKIKLFENRKNMGAGSVLRRGFNYIQKTSKADVIVIIAGDNQDNPKEISRLLDKIAEGYDFVQGSRNISYRHHRVKMPFFRRVTTTLYSQFSSAVIGRKITDSSNGFRAIRTAVLRKINYNQEWLNRYELEPFILIEAIKMGVMYAEVPVSKTYDHKAGYSKMRPLIDWYRMLKPFFIESVKRYLPK
jgi:dolichol-phosphate mannosyltransferase